MLTINGIDMPEPESFSPRPEAVYINQMENGYGEELSDYIRDRTVLQLTWEWMPPANLAELQNAINPNLAAEFPVSYDSPGGRKSGMFKISSPLRGERLDHDHLYGLIWVNVTLEMREV